MRSYQKLLWRNQFCYFYTPHNIEVKHLIIYTLKASFLIHSIRVHLPSQLVQTLLFYLNIRLDSTCLEVCLCFLQSATLQHELTLRLQTYNLGMCLNYKALIRSFMDYVKFFNHQLGSTPHNSLFVYPKTS
ncbi:unnamed protein product [Moneuplotes crassus]|uniref:Uncharacterized protein n=1 Tax=Euplotes crassus TaxID=5936 RepID=A0AAD1Y054_EUPCR|nr:unnamed protein product [Moneuplotes crassus]